MSGPVASRQAGGAARIAAPRPPRFLWWRITPLTQRRLASFRAHRRGYWSLWIFAVIFVLSMFAEFIANDRPIVVRYDGQLYWPVFNRYSEKTFGGEFDADAVYNDADGYIIGKIKEKGWVVWPLIPFSYDKPVPDLGRPSPAPPSARNWLGTDSNTRDVTARLIYGFRISVLFGLVLTILSSIIGVIAGAIQGFFGGWIDLLLQRFIEIWDSVPLLYLLIILSAIVQPNFWWLLIMMLLFSWMSLVGVVRAEFLRARNLDYVRAAKALGAPNRTMMFRHILPNAMVATLTFMPFILTGAITSLTALDFLGFGLPPGSASLGELLKQGREFATTAPWLGLTAFVMLSLMLSLLVFVGEAVRDAFDPRKAVLTGPAAEPQPEFDAPGAAATATSRNGETAARGTSAS